MGTVLYGGCCRLLVTRSATVLHRTDLVNDCHHQITAFYKRTNAGDTSTAQQSTQAFVCYIHELSATKP
jgi:hypothetical protein